MLHKSTQTWVMTEREWSRVQAGRRGKRFLRDTAGKTRMDEVTNTEYIHKILKVNSIKDTIKKDRDTTLNQRVWSH